MKLYGQTTIYMICENYVSQDLSCVYIYIYISAGTPEEGETPEVCATPESDKVVETTENNEEQGKLPKCKWNLALVKW